MPLVGNLLKTAVDLSQRLTPARSPVEAQCKVLDGLLFSAKDTAFGRFYNFEAILEAPDTYSAFRDRVPLLDYDRLHALWWYQQQQEPDITWPGKPNFFALSSGTTGKTPKRIPVTAEMLDAIRSVSLAQIKSLGNFELPPETFEKEILGLGSSINLQAHRDHLEGEISGINAYEAPEWFDYFYRPGREIAAIDDWDKRIEAIVAQADQWDVGALVGIPSWVLQMLQAIVQKYQLDHIHQLWPALSLYATGGVAFEPFRKSFDDLMGKPVHYQDTYLASEGYFAFNARPGTDAMQLALNHGVFFEFIPFNDQGFDAQGNLLKDPEVVDVSQITTQQDYALIVSTCAGAWRYMIGDTVRFTDAERLEIVLTGRTKYFLNVVGSQLSEEKMNDAIADLGEFLGQPVNEYTVGALPAEDGSYRHQWVVGTAESFSEQEARDRLDRFLAKANKNYAVAREKALRGVSLRRVPLQALYDWMDYQKQKGGQAKVPRVMPEGDLRDLLKFLDTHGSS